MDRHTEKHYEDFKGYKCTRCKKTFKVGHGDTGFCGFCDKPKLRYARYNEAAFK